MKGLIVMDYMLQWLGMCAVVVLVIAFVVWLGYVINSVARSADALERIADALEDDEDVEDEDTEKKGGAK